uniref:DUF4349 domain-containing protein n=1 Tax=Roseivirga sp. TaxID=1964215 RepID=UPI004047F24F
MLTITRPTLLLNEKQCKANIRKMVDKAKRLNADLVPHFKTHQSSEIGEWFRAFGIESITVSSVKMAEYFAQEGWENITIAFPFNVLEIPAVNKLLERNVAITLFAVNESAVERLNQELIAPVNVFIELDAGYPRSGIPTDSISEITQLALLIEKGAMTNFYGLYCHPGNTYQTNIEVQNLEKFETEFKTLLSQFKASVSNQNRNDYDRRMESNFTIRVPSSNFDQLFEALKPLAKKIENQSINLQDVTEQFIDVESRIKNRKALEDRYRELLKQAKNINDILTIERQLNQIRSEIESQEGRLKYLNDQVDMSTIQLNAFEIKPFVYEPEPTDGFGQQILKSLSDGWNRLVHLVIWVISLWPFALVIGFIVFLFKRRKKA